MSTIKKLTAAAIFAVGVAASSPALADCNGPCPNPEPEVPEQPQNPGNQQGQQQGQQQSAEAQAAAAAAAHAQATGGTAIAGGGQAVIESGAINNDVKGGQAVIESGAINNDVKGGQAVIESGAVRNDVQANGGNAVVETGAVKNDVQATGGTGGQATIADGAVKTEQSITNNIDASNRSVYRQVRQTPGAFAAAGDAGFGECNTTKRGFGLGLPFVSGSVSGSTKINKECKSENRFERMTRSHDQSEREAGREGLAIIDRNYGRAYEVVTNKELDFGTCSLKLREHRSLVGVDTPEKCNKLLSMYGEATKQPEPVIVYQDREVVREVIREVPVAAAPARRAAPAQRRAAAPRPAAPAPAAQPKCETERAAVASARTTLTRAETALKVCLAPKGM